MTNVFIHVPKTAGTSLSKTLRGKCAIYTKGHLTAYQLQRLDFFQECDNHFVFAFVRNPWDATLSYFFFRTKPLRRRRSLSQIIVVFERWLISTVLIASRRTSPHHIDQWAFIASQDRSKLLVDFVGRYESLEEDYDRLCDKLNITSPRKLAYINRTSRGPYQDYYNDSTRTMVSELNSELIQHFQYEF